MTDLPLGSGLYRWIAFETNLIGCPASDLSIQFSSDPPTGMRVKTTLTPRMVVAMMVVVLWVH
jgi:hypothetical protein